ncbi:hypothetical protein HMPREF0758_3440 [Serratia odorifera DSM 4582]|uniref:Uncharacterized protein n=1 Tax=Serratia odorifera DSM 4582 TaxID=667129 RepID=D4E5J0_SEROD|nr:hypothetical protein HMPREF0758_3440 [Serratia odorifera DSM 4582]
MRCNVWHVPATGCCDIGRKPPAVPSSHILQAKKTGRPAAGGWFIRTRSRNGRRG